MHAADKTACRPTLKRFTLAYLAGVLLVIVVSVALQVLTGIDLPASATSFVPTIIGVYAAATVFVQQHGRATTADENAHLAKWSTLLSLGLSVLLFLLVLALAMASGEDMSELSSLGAPQVLVILLLVLAVVTALTYALTRLMYRLLTKHMVKVRLSR